MSKPNPFAKGTPPATKAGKPPGGRPRKSASAPMGMPAPPFMQKKK